MPSSILTSRGRVTIPKAIRERLGLRPGDRLQFRVTAQGKMLIEPSSVDLPDLRGILKANGKHVTVEKMKAAMSSHIAPPR